jgi:hypothetical protein
VWRNLVSGVLGKRPDYSQYVAIIATFNEGDIIYHSLRKLIDQGVGVYLMDNWSSDDSDARVKPLLGRGIVGYEKFPPEGPGPCFRLRRTLERKEEIARSLSARWIIHQDVDEIRESPWPGVSLTDGLQRVVREGFNCVNHVVLRFRPVDDRFRRGSDMEAHFRYFTFERNPAFFAQKRAWLQTSSTVSLAPSGGHLAEFEGQNVFPIPFLLKHYPIRGQAHGQKKVLGERLARYDPQERAGGWHVHYDHVDAETRFLADPRALQLYDPVGTKNYLLQHPLQPDGHASFR